MKKFLFTFVLASSIISCGFKSSSDRNFTDPNRVYRLKLNPPSGSEYYYDITNESDVQLDLNDKKVDNITRSTVGMFYDIDKDSTGDFILKMRFDKIHLYTNNGETESDLDAANGANSLNQMEQMLAILKTANITSVLSPDGVVKQVHGYKEIEAQFINRMDPNDVNGRAMAQKQLDQVIGNGLIKNSMDQLFKIFPDSAIHVGEKWKIFSKQDNDLAMNTTSFFRLKDINDNIALIESEGEAKNEEKATNIMGIAAIPKITGKQEGEYQMEVKTGMLGSATIKSDIKGTVQMMGKDIPITIKNSVKLSGRKMR